MDVTRKEEYEIDPNSSFNRLRTLQKNLKEENALRENYSKSKDELLKKIDSHCYKYYKTKIAIHELYDMPIKSEINNIQYTVAENGQAELPQFYEPLYNLMFIFRNDNTMMLKLLEKSTLNHYDSLATFISHFFYENVLSTNQDSADLLLMLYLLIEKEIDALKDITSYDNFLHKSKSFVAKMFNILSRKNEVRNYLEIILHKLIIDFENLNNKTNEHNANINLDLHKIKEEINKDKKSKNHKKINDYKSFLINNLKESDVWKNLNLKGKDDKRNVSFYDDEKQIIDFYIFSKKEMENTFTYDNIEKYFEENGLYEKERKNSNVENEMNYNSIYANELTYNEINKLFKNEKNEDMKQFYKKQIDLIQNGKDDKMFTTSSFINEIQNDKELKEHAEKILLVYKYTFIKITEYIDYILYSILQNKSTIPYIIKCICVIIDKLISIKFPNTSTLNRNTFICNFFFDNLIIHELAQPSYNGLVPELIMTDAKRRKIESITKVLHQLTKASFFNGNNDKDKAYTLFNSYFIHIMPRLIEICSHLKQVKLPSIIENLLQQKKNGITNKNINYDYLKENPDEFIYLQSMCFCLDDFYLIYGIIKANEQFFFTDKTSFFGKTYKKLSFHEKTISKKISTDIENGKKTFIYLTKTYYSEKVKDSVFAQKSQKFSFQSGSEDMKENANELFIFERVKYSINTIVKHLNTLTRANFSADSESMENFVQGLNTMIELEGFSEMLKEKTIPLDWFGLYLQSNIGGIPQSKSRANYYQLYSDLIEDSQANYNIIKCDDTLNCVNSKTKISEKNIEIQTNTLINYKKTIRRFQGAKFFAIKDVYHICVTVKYKDGIPSKITILALEDPCKSKTGFLERKKTKHMDVTNIHQLFEEFPDLTQETTETDILTYQRNNNFPNSFNSFFESLKNIIHKHIIIKFESSEDFDELFIEIQNIIFRKLHPKLFPDTASENDLLLFRNCFNFSWIEPGNLHKELQRVNDKMLNVAAEFIRNLNNEISPFDKIRAVSKVCEIVQSTIKLFEIKDEFAYDMLLVYVFIKAQLMGVDSNYEYISLYITKEQRTAYYDKVLKDFSNTKTIIKNLGKEDLIGVTEEEYNKNVQKVYSDQ